MNDDKPALKLVPFTPRPTLAPCKLDPDFCEKLQPLVLERPGMAHVIERIVDRLLARGRAVKGGA